MDKNTAHKHVQNIRQAKTLPTWEVARVGSKVNFAPDKIPLWDKSPRKCETAKHRAKFGWLPLSDVGAVTKRRRKTS